MNQHVKNYDYVWSGTINHQEKSGEITAKSINLAKVQLIQQGVMIISIGKKRKKLFSRHNKKITSFDIAIFFRQLATLTATGSPLMQSCDTLQKNQEKKSLKTLIENIKHEIASGKTLVNSLRKYPQHFDPLICHLIHAGEYSGTLSAMLKRVADHKEKTIAIKKQLIKALFYPATILMIAIVITFFMLICIVPRFAELFQSMHGQLPPLTRTVIFISNTLQNTYWLLIIPLLIPILLVYMIKKSETFRQRFDQFILAIPGLGTLLQKAILARVMRNFATTFSAGVPITEAMNIISHTSGNYVYTKAFLSLKTSIMAGQQLHSAMQFNPLFPAIAVQMIKTGEESGALAPILEKIADFYEADVDHIVANMSQLLEPLIMVVLGVLIGGLVLAMYLPIFKLGTLI